MPQRDTRGPFGSGPGTGRGRGWCRGPFFSPRTGFSGKRAGFFSAIIYGGAMVIRDLLNPHGMIRSVSKGLLSNRKQENKNEPVNTDYTVVNPDKEVDSKGLSKQK